MRRYFFGGQLGMGSSSVLVTSKFLFVRMPVKVNSLGTFFFLIFSLVPLHRRDHAEHEYTKLDLCKLVVRLLWLSCLPGWLRSHKIVCFRSSSTATRHRCCVCGTRGARARGNGGVPGATGRESGTRWTRRPSSKWASSLGTMGNSGESWGVCLHYTNTTQAGNFGKNCTPPGIFRKTDTAKSNLIALKIYIDRFFKTRNRLCANSSK